MRNGVFGTGAGAEGLGVLISALLRFCWPEEFPGFFLAEDLAILGGGLKLVKLMKIWTCAGKIVVMLMDELIFYGSGLDDPVDSMIIASN